MGQLVKNVKDLPNKGEATILYRKGLYISKLSQSTESTADRTQEFQINGNANSA